MAPIYTVAPYMGELPMMKAFIVVVLGGLGSLPGAVVGGLMLGIVESAFATMLGSTAAALVAFAVVVVTIAVRPEGLMGRRA
jgi:branched-chain amino acid transport system permease protein